MAMTIENQTAIVTELANLLVGKEKVAASAVGPFVEIANVTNVQGKDALMNAISQMVTKTYYTVRAYSGNHFKGIVKNTEEFGNAVRRIAFLESNAPEADPTYNATFMADGQSIDHYKINKVKPIQLWISGQRTYMRTMTVTTNALKAAMTSPEALAEFVAEQFVHFANMIEGDKEAEARGVLVNMVLAKTGYTTTASSSEYSANTDHVCHLVTEYNAFVGKTGENAYTLAQLMDDTLQPAFARFCRARVAEFREMFTNRTICFHQNPTGMSGAPVICRDTPEKYQNFVLMAKWGLVYDNMVKEQSHNPAAMTPITVEKLGYLQAPDKPDSAKGKYNTLKADGTQVSITTARQVNNVLGVLYDSDAMGITLINEETLTTPVNAFGSYYNVAHHFNCRYYLDLTMPAVVFLLD